MKVNLRPALWQRVRKTVLRWSGKPAVEEAAWCLAAAGVGFLLAGTELGGCVMPFSVAWAAALGMGLRSFSAYLGGCAGYALFFGGAGALEPAAAGLLVEACLCIFGDEIAARGRWFPSACAAVFTAVLGALMLLQLRIQPRHIWQLLLRIIVAWGATAVFREALNPAGKRSRLILTGCLCVGLCAVRPFGFPLGIAAGCCLGAAAAGTASGLSAAVLSGLALELGAPCPGATAVLTLGCLCCRRFSNRRLRPLIWLVSVLAGVLLSGADPMLLVGAVAGALLSVPVPEDIFALLPTVGQQDPRLQLAAGLMEQLSSCLALTRSAGSDPGTNTVFDRAADRVCRSCGQWELCWEKELEATCEALDRAAPAMLAEGRVRQEDLPPWFSDRCRHWDSFLRAINRELDDLRCRLQYRSRLRETRQILVRQYSALSAAMAHPRPETEGDCRFQPELGFRSHSRCADTMSGDRGAGFRVGQWFYLLLCDGMGTGMAAGAEAGAAIGILRTLLQAGVEPSEALCLLNGIYILRDDGGFATVDLLQADLTTGEARLLKWGGAPSYLKRRSELEKLGTATPPPGVGVGEAHRPEEMRLSMSRGEMLVLVSDGIEGEAAERFVRQYTGVSPKELANGIVGCGTVRGEDDRTAAVLKLVSCLSG